MFDFGAICKVKQTAVYSTADGPTATMCNTQYYNIYNTAAPFIDFSMPPSIQAGRKLSRRIFAIKRRLPACQKAEGWNLWNFRDSRSPDQGPINHLMWSQDGIPPTSRTGEPKVVVRRAHLMFILTFSGWPRNVEDLKFPLAGALHR